MFIRLLFSYPVMLNLIQAVKRCAALKKAIGKKDVKIQGDGQEMAVMVG